MKRTRRAVLVLAVAMTATGLSGAGTASADPPAAKVTTFENFGFVRGPDGGLVLNWGFAPRTVAVPSGSSVMWTNTSTDGEPHTISVASAAEVPKTIGDIFGCFAPDAFCGKVLVGHDPDNNGQPPFQRNVNVGKPGLNTSGDSRLLLAGQSTFPRVTAPAGTTLHYICAIHPWMQAQVNVT